MGVLSAGDADDLGRQLSGDTTKNFVVYNNIRKGMTQLGATRFVPQADAISGAGGRSARWFHWRNALKRLSPKYGGERAETTNRTSNGSQIRRSDLLRFSGAKHSH
jgi:hypothetical protein